MLVNGVKLTQRIIAKAPGLLPMRYKLTEIAEKLNLHPRTLSDWTDAGLPHEHDSRGHIWIVGTDFAGWVEENRKSANKKSDRPKLAEDEAHCMRCKKAVKLIAPAVIPGRGKQVFIKGRCSICGCIINRGGRKND